MSSFLNRVRSWYAKENAKVAESVRIPDSTEPIIAYRAWGLNSGRLAPASFSPAAEWEPRKSPRAKCGGKFYISISETRCKAPDRDCHCGYHGFKTVADLRQVIHNPVLGRVALWGRVIEHEGGYRAEYAYPQVLYTHPALDGDYIKTLADLYGIETAPAPAEIERHLDGILESRRQQQYELAWRSAIELEQRNAALFPGGVLDLAEHAKRLEEARKSRQQVFTSSFPTYTLGVGYRLG